MLPVDKVVRVWDRLLFHPASYPLFLGIALLEQLRTSLLSLDQTRIMSLIPKLADYVDIDRWLEEGERLQNQLPPSLTLLSIAAQDPGTSAERWWQAGFSLEVVQKTLTPFLEAHDLVGIFSSSLVVEVRTQEEYNQQHVNGSLLVPLQAKVSQTTISKGVMSSIRSQCKGKTIVVVGDKRKISHSVTRYIDR